jgi:hypothetical protein
MSMSLLTERYSEKYGKKLIGRAGIKHAIKRLDKLTQEETRMAAAQSLRAAHTVDERVINRVLAAIENRPAIVDNRVASTDNEVTGTQIVFSRA